MNFQNDQEKALYFRVLELTEMITTYMKACGCPPDKPCWACEEARELIAIDEKHPEYRYNKN